jgi:HPt (histidine-containing phosphotransfer) domain-containing protein
LSAEQIPVTLDFVGATDDVTEPLFDNSVLDQIRQLQMDDEPDLVSEVIRTYFQDTDAIMDSLCTAQIEGDITIIKRSAHTLKSSSANVGAMMLAVKAKRLEDGCENNSLEINEDIINILQDDYIRTKTVLEKELV